MKQTALDWLLEQMSKEGMLPKLEDYHKAKQMESEQTISKMETIRENGIVELSDEEIEKEGLLIFENEGKNIYKNYNTVPSWVEGAKWMRDKILNK